LKEELRRRLHTIEQAEALSDQRFAPQTVEEAEKLETKLSDALAEVRRIKAGLRSEGEAKGTPGQAAKRRRRRRKKEGV
jgi:hypothetical protein